MFQHFHHHQGPHRGHGFGHFGHGHGHGHGHGPNPEGDFWGKGPFGRRGGFGGFGPGPGGRFGRGDLKFVILDAVKDQPRHGYDVIRAIEERFHGFYSPSPGSVYPTLQLLEDQGYVSSAERDGKRLYSITEAGQTFLAEQSDVLDAIKARVANGWGPRANPEIRELIHEVQQLGQFLFRQGAGGALGDPEKVRQLRAAVAHARQEIEAIFTGTGAGVPPETMV